MPADSTYYGIPMLWSMDCENRNGLKQFSNYTFTAPIELELEIDKYIQADKFSKPPCHKDRH